MKPMKAPYKKRNALSLWTCPCCEMECPMHVLDCPMCGAVRGSRIESDDDHSVSGRTGLSRSHRYMQAED